MTTSFTNLVNNLAEGFIKLHVKYEHDDKKCQTCRTKYKYCDCFLEYTNSKEDLIKDQCLCCNKNCQKMMKSYRNNFF